MAAHAATASRARALLFREGVLAGTLNEQTVGSAPRFTLTDKAAGKTRCLYVPAAMAPKVRRMTANWRELKAVLLEMSAQAREALVEEITAMTGRPTVRQARQKAGEDAAGAQGRVQVLLLGQPDPVRGQRAFPALAEGS